MSNPETVSATLLTSALPSILKLPDTSPPEKVTVLAVAHLEAVSAFPVRSAIRLPLVMPKLPVEAGVAVVVPKWNLSSLSSQTNTPLLPVEPLSNINPMSLLFDVGAMPFLC